MIIFDYKLSDTLNINGWHKKLPDLDEIEIRYNFLLGDVIILAGECDFSARWGWVPILDFVCSLKYICTKLCQNENLEMEFEFTESESTLKFSRKGDLLTITASYNQCISTVTFDDFIVKADEFASRLILDVFESYPESINNSWLNSVYKTFVNK